MGVLKYNEAGNRYGRLKVVSPTANGHWLCKCDCGKKANVCGSKMRAGMVKSCGCWRKDSARILHTTHNLSFTRFHSTYRNILSRCNNKNNKRYFDYGGRGIKCIWDSFENFRDDMYASYLNHVETCGESSTTIDRIDNNGNYCKENCRWASRTEQSKNRRSTILVELGGRTLCVFDWSKEFKIPAKAIYHRIDRGWSPEKAITTPLLTFKQN